MTRAIVTYSRGWHALAVTRSLGRQGIEVSCGEEAPFAPVAAIDAPIDNAT